MSTTQIDPHIRRTAPPSPVVLKPAALPTTAQAFTLIGWVEGDRHVYHVDCAIACTPDEGTFAQCYADAWERENGERYSGGVDVRNLVVVKGKAEVCK